MEYFDILNKDGIVTGKIASKGEKLSEDDYYLGVHGYIHNSNGEFLLQKRSMSKEFLPGEWDIHMGHVIAGETGKMAITREIYEELGIKLEDMKLIKRIIYEQYNHFIDIFVACKDVELSELKLQKSEVEDVKYISSKDMINLIRKMDYRPKEYRTVMEKYVIELSFEED